MTTTAAPAVDVPRRGAEAQLTAVGRPRALLLMALLIATALPVARDRLLLLDLACVLALPLLLATIGSHRRLGALALVALGWLVGQVLADTVNDDGPRPS